MKTTMLFGVLATAVMFEAPAANAALVNDGSILLTINPGVVTCPLGGAYPECNLDISTATGSYFQVGSGGHRVVEQGTGIILGSTQSYDGNPVSTGTPYDGSGQNITTPWLWGKDFDENGVFYPVGTNWTTSAITANNTGGLDMSGWHMTWFDVADSNFGGGGIGTFQCFDVGGLKAVGTCQAGDSYILDYNVMNPPVLNASGEYNLHLEGQITAFSTVPIPAAIWLFGSGLIGLIGVAKRKKA